MYRKAIGLLSITSAENLAGQAPAGIVNKVW
jgi:hypothetical protein